MKKLLVLALVLSMTTMASAMFQLSIDGDKFANEATINVVPSGTVELGIWTNAMIAPNVNEGFFALGAATAGGTMSGGTIIWPGDEMIYQDGAGSGIGFAAGDNGPYGVVALAVSSSIASGSNLFSGIIFHCEGPGDVIVTLYDLNGDTGELGSILDSVVIHQVPEPMTMALLGFGGLFLRRRK